MDGCSATGDISPVGRVLKVRFGVRYPLTTTCLAKWGGHLGRGVGVYWAADLTCSQLEGCFPTGEMSPVRIHS